MSSKYCGTVSYKQGTNDENIKETNTNFLSHNAQIKWDIWKFYKSNGAKNAASAEH